MDTTVTSLLPNYQFEIHLNLMVLFLIRIHGHNNAILWLDISLANQLSMRNSYRFSDLIIHFDQIVLGKEVNVVAAIFESK